MNRLLAIFMVFCMMASSVCYADETYETPISLCYDGDAYSVDYVFEVTGDASVTEVILNDNDCYFDWNYIASEARLYISLASGNVIERADTIATIISDAEIELIPVKVVVNGKIKNDVYAFHTPDEIEEEIPTIEKPGSTSGELCISCGLILVKPEILPAKGPSVKAILDSDGVLMVSGGLSDSSNAEGMTYLAVYDESNRMIHLEDITDLDQSDFNAEIENVTDACTVKVMRFAYSSYSPLDKAVEADVK